MKIFKTTKGYSRRPVPLLHRLEPLSVHCLIWFWHKCPYPSAMVSRKPHLVFYRCYQDTGTLIDCILALFIVRHTMSFKMLCRVCLPAFFKKQCNHAGSVNYLSTLTVMRKDGYYLLFSHIIDWKFLENFHFYRMFSS